MPHVTKLQNLLFGFGFASIFGGFYMIATGEAKWNEEVNFTGTKARLLGAGVVGFGLLLGIIGIMSG